MVHLEILQLVLLPSWTLTRISTIATTFVEGFGIYKAASFPKLGSLSIHSLHIEWYNYNNPSRFLGFDHNTRILWRVREKFDIAQGGAIRSYLLMKGFVVRTMLLSVCFLLCKLEVNNQCNQSPIESRNWNFLAFYEKVCWYNLNSIEKTVLRSNGLCRTWYYSQFGLYDNSTGVDK